MKKKDYILRNDLAIQNKKYKEVNNYTIDNIKIRQYSYKKFLFSDIFFENIETNKNKVNLKKAIVMELKKLLKKYSLNKKSSCLVVGLGNKNIISDALGVETCKSVISSGYFNLLNINNYIYVYIYIPVTTKESGVETFKGKKVIINE